MPSSLFLLGYFRDPEGPVQLLSVTARRLSPSGLSVLRSPASDRLRGGAWLCAEPGGRERAGGPRHSCAPLFVGVCSPTARFYPVEGYKEEGQTE